MKQLIFSDLHITEQDIQECKNILNEILSIAQNNKVEELITLGDIFDKYNPTNEEINLFCEFLNKINVKTYIVVAPSHESISSENNIFKHFELLNSNIKVIYKELILDNIFFGHFTLKESLKGFNETKSIKDFKNFKYVLLGHQHTFQKITENIYHIGSSRWVRFDEDHNISKKIVILDNNELNFIDLKTPIKMIDIVFNNENDIKSLNKNLKVRLIFKSYSALLTWLNLSEKYKNCFSKLSIKEEFEQIEVAQDFDKKTINYKKDLLEWLEKSNIDEKIKNLLKEKIYV